MLLNIMLACMVWACMSIAVRPLEHNLTVRNKKSFVKITLIYHVV